MIPRSLSSETNQDSEPHLTVNPANPRQIVGTAFSPNPGGGKNGPIYVSLDGGNTWTLNPIVPSAPGDALGTGDITTSFNSRGTRLYASILRAATFNMEFLRTTAFTSPTTMTVLASRPEADQPFSYAVTVLRGRDAGRDRVYVGNNDFAAPDGRTATVDTALNAGIVAPGFAAARIERRDTAGQDGPQTRPTCHPDGTVYAAFYRWRDLEGSFGANTLVITSADVLMVRDDDWGSGPHPYTALVDPGDGIPGLRVAQNVRFRFNREGTSETGQQRIGGSISVAVDPRNSSTVYLAYGHEWHGRPRSFLTLHVRRSTDRGQTWSGELLTVDNATNAALAINKNGVIGFLCQQLTGHGASRHWVSRFKYSSDGTQWTDVVLANTPANTPVKTFDPYLGDYDHLVAVSKDFYGIFSANNTPDAANFPNGVRYQRNANFATRRLLRLDNRTVVAPSIDPFFFKFTFPY